VEKRDQRETRPGQTGKRPYEPPEILSQEVFETTALACGKRPGQSPACNANKKS
jgi:hypothetical protein